VKEVITNTWCDAHKAKDVSEEVHGLTMTLVIDTEGPMTLDLCADCITEFVDPLKKLMATFGQPVELPTAPKRRARKVASSPAPAPERPADASEKASTKPAKKAAAKRSKNKAKGPTPAQIRAWAVDQGMAIPDRGRIPADVREAFIAAGGK
jgi:hypothetical protein